MASVFEQCMDGLSISKWVVNVVRSLPAYNWGRVVLLGDAVRLLAERNLVHHKERSEH